MAFVTNEQIMVFVVGKSIRIDVVCIEIAFGVDVESGTENQFDDKFTNNMHTEHTYPNLVYYYHNPFTIVIESKGET